MRTCPNLPKQNECDRTKNGARDYNGGIGGYRGHSISNWGELANRIASECYRNVIRKKLLENVGWRQLRTGELAKAKNGKKRIRGDTEQANRAIKSRVHKLDLMMQQVILGGDKR